VIFIKNDVLAVAIGEWYVSL